MEITCTRCQQAVQAENCYCPVCGLPQLVYSADSALEQGQPERWNEAVRDASSVDWKRALRTAIVLSIPAGFFCSILSPLSVFALPLMAAAAAWAVVLYVRSQRPAWITIGAGARIGLVTGMISSWMAAATTGIILFAMRYWFNQGSVLDGFWQNLVYNQLTPQWTSMGVDAQTIASMKAWILPPEGRAGWLLAATMVFTTGLLLFAVAGGALGARLAARKRRPEI